MSKAAGNIFNNLTYNPEAAAAAKADKAAARDQKQKFLTGIAIIKKSADDQRAAGQISNVAYTAVSKVVSDGIAWPKNNKEATADDYDDQGQIVIDNVNNIMSNNQAQLYFEKYLLQAELGAAILKNKAVDKIVKREKDWYSIPENQTLQLSEYQDRAEKDNLEFTTAGGNPQTTAGGNPQTTDVSRTDLSGTNVTKLKKAVVQQKEVNAAKKPTFWENVIGQFWSVMYYGTIALVLVLGGSLAANLTIHRPVAYRVLNFIYGALGSPFVIIYGIFRLMSFKPIPIYSLLIPIWEGEPTFRLRFFTYSKSDEIDKASQAFFKTTNMVSAAASLASAAATATREEEQRLIKQTFDNSDNLDRLIKEQEQASAAHVQAPAQASKRDVPSGSENLITGDNIKEGNAMVNIARTKDGKTDYDFGEYHKNTAEIREIKTNPSTRKELTPNNFTPYTATITPLPAKAPPAPSAPQA